jgi:hypothetical protein
MLELFKEDIPFLYDLIPDIKKMISNSRYELEDIRDLIAGHIFENTGDGSEDSAAFGDAVSVATSAVDDLIIELEENEVNCRRIKRYLENYQSFSGYHRLITEFAEFLSNAERNRLIATSKQIFAKEFADWWDPFLAE